MFTAFLAELCVFFAIFFKQLIAIWQKQSITLISQLKNIFHSTKSTKAKAAIFKNGGC